MNEAGGRENRHSSTFFWYLLYNAEFQNIDCCFHRFKLVCEQSVIDNVALRGSSVIADSLIQEIVYKWNNKLKYTSYYIIPV